MVAFFRPRVGKKHQDPVEYRPGEPRQQVANVVVENADILQMIGCSFVDETPQARTIDFDRNEIFIRVRRGQSTHASTIARPYLERDWRIASKSRDKIVVTAASRQRVPIPILFQSDFLRGCYTAVSADETPNRAIWEITQHGW